MPTDYRKKKKKNYYFCSFFELASRRKTHTTRARARSFSTILSRLLGYANTGNHSIQRHLFGLSRDRVVYRDRGRLRRFRLWARAWGSRGGRVDRVNAVAINFSADRHTGGRTTDTCLPRSAEERKHARRWKETGRARARVHQYRRRNTFVCVFFFLFFSYSTASLNS